MRRLAVLALLCGCGRLGFDAIGDDDDGVAPDAGAIADAPEPVEPALGCTGSRGPVLDLADARLAGYWSFNGGTTVAADASPAGLAGQPVGAPITIGDGIGSAKRFTGDDSFAIAAGADDVGQGDLTIEALVRSTSCDGPIVARAAAWGLSCEAGRALVRFVDRGGTALELRSQTRIDDGGWHHLIGIRRGAALELWLDGERVATTPSALGRLDSTSALAIAGPFVGDLDEIRIWRAALAPDEIARIRAVFRPDLVGYWPFDRDAAGFAGTPYSGTVIGIATVADARARAGRAAHFGGSTGRIDISAPDVFRASYTATAWFRTTAPGAQAILNREDEIDPSSPVQLWLTGAGVDARSATLGGGAQASLADGCWHHAALVRSGDDFAPGAVRLYLDGALALEETGTFGATALPAPALRAGFRLIRDPRAFTGEIDEIQLYSRALSSAELAAAYRALR